jgi:thioredoxin-related protein
MKSTVYILLFSLFSSNTISFAQVTPLAISKLDSNMAASPKPVLMLLSTDWCKYCQLQKGVLGKHKEFQRRSDRYYFVGFDAESPNPEVFRGKQFKSRTTALSPGNHELAVALAGSEQIAFPMWILLDDRYDVLFRHSGVLSRQQISQLLEALDQATGE